MCFGLSLLIASGSIAQTPKIQFEEYSLDNGLHVILHEDHSTPIVNVSVMYHVGSKNEDPQLTGFAHLFEHLMFEGSKNIGRGEYSEYVEKAGGTLNASTSNDRTYYYETLPSNQLELGLWLESERMLHAKIDSEGIATQKKVVIEEKKQNYDNRPYGSIMIETMKRAYNKHPYRWTTIGDTNHIRSASNQDIKQFYDTFYVPNNAVLTVAGDIEKDRAKKLIEKYFADIPKKEEEIPRPDVEEPVKNKEIRDTVYDNIRLPAIIQAYHTPAMGTDDYYAVDMLSTLLSEGQSSRLYKNLVDKKELATQVSLFPMPLEDPGVAIVLALPNMGVDNKKLEKAMDAEIDKVKNNTISDKEFEKLKNQFETQIVQQNSTIARRVQNLARNYTYFNNTDLINHRLEKYLSVTKDDIKRVANKYFREDNRVV
ncbi:MAG: insulinase family protein, partial [Bacteroidales bacterium]|nr:insulinase family protein [Bacteroidales bacterium]